jgi:hypothetical protein
MAAALNVPCYGPRHGYDPQSPSAKPAGGRAGELGFGWPARQPACLWLARESRPYPRPIASGGGVGFGSAPSGWANGGLDERQRAAVADDEAERPGGG